MSTANSNNSNRTPLIYTLGELLAEYGSHNEAGVTQFAGDTLNAAVAAQQVGAEVFYQTAVPEDHQAQVIAFIQSLGLTAEGIKTATGRMGSYQIQLNGAGERSFVFDRDASAARQLSFKDLNQNAMSAAHGVVITAVLPAISTSVFNCLEGIAKAAHKAVILLDPNFRAELTPKASVINVIEKLKASIHILSLSDSDQWILDELMLPGPPDSARSSRVLPETRSEWLTAFPSLRFLLLKEGPHGATLWDLHQEITVSVAAPTVDAVDTTGCGDVLNGTFLAKLLCGTAPTDAIHRAVAIASCHATHFGGLPQLAPTNSNVTQARGS